MIKAQNNVGNVKISKDQTKWHISQIDESSLSCLVRKFKQLDKTQTTFNIHHLKDKESHTTYKEVEIKNLLNRDITSLIVEYNRTLLPREGIYDERIVIRDDKSIITTEGMQNTCIVFSLTKNKIVTIYYNKPNDNHNTINRDRYCSMILKLKCK